MNKQEIVDKKAKTEYKKRTENRSYQNLLSIVFWLVFFSSPKQSWQLHTMNER